MQVPDANADADDVSLYALERPTGLHRDTLRTICLRAGIPISFRRVSTDRYVIRVISRDDVGRLLRAARSHPRRRRATGPPCPACGARRPGADGSATPRGTSPATSPAGLSAPPGDDRRGARTD